MHSEIAIGILISFVCIAVVLLFCAILIKLYIHKIQNYTKVIYEKDIEHQKALTTTVIETQEHVLDNISRDLHDDAGQQLTYINFQLENLKLDSQEMQGLLDPVSESLKRLSESIRSISHSLNNQLLMRQDLIAAIQAEVQRLQKTVPFKITYEVAATSRNFPDNQKIVLYRIFQEIITNICKHAKASTVKISVSATPQFRMEVEDDGIGFNACQESGNSLGLIGMKKRAELIDHQLEIVSSPGNGTRITITENHS